MFVVDQKGLTFICQISEKDATHVLRVLASSAVFAVERECGLEISELDLSTKESRTVVTFKAKSNGYPRDIIRTIPVSENFTIIVTHN